MSVRKGTHRGKSACRKRRTNLICPINSRGREFSWDAERRIGGAFISTEKKTGV